MTDYKILKNEGGFWDVLVPHYPIPWARLASFLHRTDAEEFVASQRLKESK